MDSLQSNEPDAEVIQDLVMVIDRAGLIENLFNQIITAYVAPREHAKHFTWVVMLDTSIMPLASKQKVVMAIARELNFSLKKNPLIMVIQYRNAFAHHTTYAHPVIQVGRTPAENTSYQMLHIMNSDGEVKEVKRHEALDSFNKYYEEAKVSLVGLLRAVEKQIALHKEFVRPPQS